MGILYIDDFTCYDCKRKYQPEIDSKGNLVARRLSVDHYIALDNHGTTEFDNLYTMCIDCNKSKSNFKSNHTIDELKAWRKETADRLGVDLDKYREKWETLK